jgi:hypothetical protein
VKTPRTPPDREIKIAHCFYGVFMGFQHRSMGMMVQAATSEKELPPDQVAVFVSRKFDSVKILYDTKTLLYHRTGMPGAVTPELVRFLPTLVGGKPLVFSKNLETNMMKAFKSQFGEEMKRMQMIAGQYQEAVQ